MATVARWWRSSGLGLLALVLSATLAVLATGCSTSVPADVGPPQRIELSYSGGAVRGGAARVPVALGRQVQLVVASDVADEVHVHGYDYKADVAAGGTSTLAFRADRSGVFEVELENLGVQLAQLEVR